MTESGAYDALNEEQRELVDMLIKESGPTWERLAMLELLKQPGYEAAFLARYFGDSLDAKLEDFHIRLITTALYESRGLVLFPATHGKTTLISCLLPILEIIRNPDIRIAIIAKNDNEAGAIISRIQSELENNELLIQDYGPFRPDNGDTMRKWASDFFSVRQRRRLGKEHTLAVFGAGSRQILGWRTDHVICDDVVTERNSATEDQRNKHVTWFNDCVATSPQKKKGSHGQITVVGTMFHPRDLYATIREKTNVAGQPIYKWHREDAIRDWAKQEPLWPAVWTWAELMDVKSSEGTLSFNKRYRNKPVDESEQPFREDWLRGQRGHPGCADPHRVIGQFDPDWRIFQMLDPAVGKGKNAKKCGWIVFGVDPVEPRKRKMIDWDHEQWTVPQQRDKIIDTHLWYAARANMVMSVTETNAYQAGLKQIIDEKCDQLGVTIRCEGHTTGLNKQDPEIGIPSLSVLVENGYLEFPTGNPESLRKTEYFWEELIEYPFHPFTDLVMALWFGHLKSNIAVPVYKSTNRLVRKSRYRHLPHDKMVKNPYFLNQSRVDPRLVQDADTIDQTA
jgi:hypothetical protein